MAIRFYLHQSNGKTDSHELHLSDDAFPLVQQQLQDLRWYLESYPLWPTGLFKQRAEVIEQNLPHWGQALYEAVSGVQKFIFARNKDADTRKNKFLHSVDIEIDLNNPNLQAQAAAIELLHLPWELLHDGENWLLQGSITLRRSIHGSGTRDNIAADDVIPQASPIRVLILSPRPERDGLDYIDHRLSLRALLDAMETLPVEVDMLAPPTLPALLEALDSAEAAGRPYHVLHFDGHGVYRKGQGFLCFEAVEQEHKLEGRDVDYVSAAELGQALARRHIRLVFLDACHSAAGESQASVAAHLLQQGIPSVVAMSYSVLVETARRFSATFYQRLSTGGTVGEAVRAGQRALAADSERLEIRGAGALHLLDWFVPVLYQNGPDLQLFQPQTSASATAPPEAFAPPAHGFVGRGRDLLKLERLLRRKPYTVLRGQGGAGKTTLAQELARWLVRSRRFQRFAVVSLEQYDDARSALDCLGRQLLGEHWSVAHYPDLDAALEPVTAALREHATLLVFDNCESVLSFEKINTSGTRGTKDTNAESNETLVPFVSLVPLVLNLLKADKHTRLLFTSRERLPELFAAHHLELGALSYSDAITLVRQVLAVQNLPLHPEDSGDSEQSLHDLVDSLNRHARALVLFAPEVARRGVYAATREAADICAEMERQHPGDRENSLYASIELSLRRLPEDLRALVPGLAVFYGGGQWQVMGDVLQVEQETASALVKALARARSLEAELLQAIACKRAFGHDAEPWKTWDNLRKLEQAEGNLDAAAEARAEAISAYLAYRRDGGENHEYDAQLCDAVYLAVQQGGDQKLTEYLDELARRDDLRVFAGNLRMVLGGNRDPDLDDMALYYRNAVELQLLLEKLNEVK